jgi:hypothetical protein
METGKMTQVLWIGGSMFFGFAIGMNAQMLAYYIRLLEFFHAFPNLCAH